MQCLIQFWLLIEGYIFFMGPHLLPPIPFVPPYCSIVTIQCLNASQIMTQLELPCVLLLSTPNRPPKLHIRCKCQTAMPLGLHCVREENRYVSSLVVTFLSTVNLTSHNRLLRNTSFLYSFPFGFTSFLD